MSKLVTGTVNESTESSTPAFDPSAYLPQKHAGVLAYPKRVDVVESDSTFCFFSPQRFVRILNLCSCHAPLSRT